MIKFNKGDRVILINTDEYFMHYGITPGSTGTVVEYDPIPFVEWDEPSQNYVPELGTAVNQDDLLPWK